MTKKEIKVENNGTITIYYKSLPQEEVSLDEKNWIPVSGYNEYSKPYFNFNDNPDWCTIEISQNKEWLICFVKLQNNGSPIYLKGFKALPNLENIVVFLCEEIVKDEISQKWKKRKNNE